MSSIYDYLNLFWQIRRSKRITSLQADVYYCLLQECNARGWENPFEFSNKLICATIGISEPSLIDARNRLQQVGLIAFDGGKAKQQSPVYTLNLYLNNLSINPSINPSINRVKTEYKPEYKAEYYIRLDEEKDNKTPKPPCGDLPPQKKAEGEPSAKEEGDAIADDKGSKKHPPGSGAPPWPDLVDRVVAEFARVYKRLRGLEYHVMSRRKERNAAGKLLTLYLEKHPGSDTSQVLDGLRSYFETCLSQTADGWLHRNMSLSLIACKFNEINYLLYGKAAKTTAQSHATTDAELACTLARIFAGAGV